PFLYGDTLRELVGERLLVETLAKRHLLHADDGDDPHERGDDRGGEECGMERIREVTAEHWREPVHAEALAGPARLLRQALVHDHADDRHTDRRADRARELRQRRCRTHRAAADRVLYGEDEHLHHRPDPDAGDDHVARGL